MSATLTPVFLPPKPQALEIAGPAGVLEAVWEEPAQADAGLAALVCHPHPLYGGSMTNKVVHMAARALHERGIATLKFNFRGVGRSAGAFDEGNGETQDALAALATLTALKPAAKILVAGFSFGAYIAYKVATQRRIERLILIAPPVQRFQFASEPVPTMPWYVIQGDRDELVDHHAVLAWAKDLAPPPTVQMLPGAEHFFHGRMTDLKACVQQCLM
jgi:uncharacterized protein